MALKLTSADKWFSLCIREAAGWTCHRCHTYYPDGEANGGTRALHCSHYFGRGNWSVRFDPLNAMSHCYGCHMQFQSDNQFQHQHYLEIFGPGALEILSERKNDASLGRQLRKEKREIAKHYKEQFERMRAERMNGKRIELVGYV